MDIELADVTFAVRDTGTGTPVVLVHGWPDHGGLWRRQTPGLVDAGYRDDGAPGERAVYHPGYYGAYVLDPDGNNVEMVHHNR
jgi:pimeloyl-ACP methyl ester carboxylesterase